MDTVVDKAGMEIPIANDLIQRATVIIAVQELLMHPKSQILVSDLHKIQSNSRKLELSYVSVAHYIYS